MSERTIAAIATPLGEGSIGVIRISGDKAIEIADKVFFAFSGKPLCELKGYTAAYGEIKDKDSVLDDAVALVFRAPKSYTGEDIVEISIHGGRLMLKAVLRVILQNGAFLAEAGEFTKRAFLNGKLDLTKAESVMGLISARSESELRLSRAAHIGGVAEKIDKIESDLVSADASIAAFSDYPDEDIEGLDYDNFLRMLVSAKAEIENMLSNYDAGRILREGIDTVIVGKPNVGKSTLMNMLSGAERSIVTDVAGTTRDVIEDTVTVGDITLRLADTAGIHNTDDTVESIGVKRAKERIDFAELVLAVFDGTSELDKDDLKFRPYNEYIELTLVAFGDDKHKFSDNLSTLERELNRSKEEFIKEHINKYGKDEFPPVWKLLELASFGCLTKLYFNFSDNKIKKSIARSYKVPQHEILESWMKSINVLRNACAHHSRVWNRVMAVMPQLPNNLNADWITIKPAANKLYAILCCLHYWLNAIYPTNSFKNELHKLLAEYPNVDTSAMGFPTGWENEPLWK